MTTISSSKIETTQGTHLFDVFPYSLHEGHGVGEFVASGTFTVGGHRWTIRCYPDGHPDHAAGSVSVALQLVTGGDAGVRAAVELSLIDCAAGRRPYLLSGRWSKTPLPFHYQRRLMFGYQLERSLLESLGYIHGDRLRIQCVLTVLGEPQSSPARALPRIEVPPSDVAERLRELWEGKDHADVTFDVQGEIITAHRLVLAMRSPVFEAELYGPMKEKDSPCITIHGIQPEVFKTLFYFIYADSLPAAMDDLDEDTKRELLRHLLVAADLYQMDRLKLLCESRLSTSLTARSVTSTLALADRHGCHKLKDACVEFIITLAIEDDAVATKEEEQEEPNCFSTVIKCLWKEICSKLKLH